MYGDIYKLKELPFISNIPADGRAIPSLELFDDNIKKHRAFIPYKNNEFMEINTGGNGLIKGIYWSKYIDNYKTSLYMGSIHLLYNNFSYIDPKGKNKGLIDIIHSIIQDIYNFGAIIHKQHIIWNYIQSNNNIPSRSNAYDIYITEIEYLMGLIRSYFDLLYEIFIKLSNYSSPNMTNINLKKIKTLGKFSDKIIRDVEASNGKLNQYKVLKSYNLTEPFINFFTEILPLFRLSRNIRDAIYHSGKTPQIIFITDNGPGISMKNINSYFNDPFSVFKEIFKKEENFDINLLENDIVSLFYFVNVLIGLVLDYTELFGQAIQSFYKKLPDNISNEYFILIKGPEIKYINKITNNLKDAWLIPLNKSYFNQKYWNFLKI